MRAEGFNVDPRRKMDERLDRVRRSRIPFIETYRETASEAQSIGPAVDHEIIVIRIKKSDLRLFGYLAAFIAIIALIGIFSPE